MIDSLRAIEASSAQIAALLPWVLGFVIAGTLSLTVLVVLKLYDLFAPLGKLQPEFPTVHVKFIHKNEPDAPNVTE